jgi:REP element-mobilizing transposase RayT
MAHTYTNLLEHIVFSTKDRRPFLDTELKPRLFAYIGGNFRQEKCVALIINGPTDHVHILVSVARPIAPATLIGKVKANSSSWIHKTFAQHRDFAWQMGYSAFGVSHSLKGTVYDYIANQEKHHRRMSFKEELIALLKKHEIEYDERYVFE